MTRQQAATVAAYVLGSLSLAAALVWWRTGNWTWAWPAAVLWVGAVVITAWLWFQPLPRERRTREHR